MKNKVVYKIYQLKKSCKILHGTYNDSVTACYELTDLQYYFPSDKFILVKEFVK